MSILFRAYPLARSILFSMDPERAHEVTLGMLQRAYDFAPTRALMSSQVPDPITLMGLTLPNPVGLAAGLDKNGVYPFGLLNVTDKKTREVQFKLKAMF